MIRKIKNIKHWLLAILAVARYRHPAKDLKVIGVTGTDGKTTTVHMITYLLSRAGYPTGMISTTGASIRKKSVSIGPHVTTPSAGRIQRLLRQMVEEGIEYVVVEVTSHGLDQHRLLGCNFRVAVLTNITREHLDYHGTYQRYIKTKAALFRHARYAVLNADDSSYQRIKQGIKEEMTSIITYSLKKGANYTPDSFPFQTSLIGEYNQYNCLAAIAVAKIFEVPDKKIRKALASFSGVPGRLQEIKTNRHFKIFIDFAHTPGSFAQVIPAVKNITKGKLIHVFGCTGQRDREKRPQMGRIAAKFGDKIILTHEDTYREDAAKIIGEIEPGLKSEGRVKGQDYWVELERSRAIKRAIEMAHKKDTVLITGVGHQQFLNIDGREVPWSEREAVIRALSQSNGT